MSAEGDLFNAVAALERVAESIRKIEMEAREALYSRDEPEVYRQKLQEKAMLLADLPDTIEPFLAGMPKAARAEVKSGARDFARRAIQALELSSVFYMSALLYPDDYEDGQKNDLEKFVDRLRSKYLA